MDSSVIWSFEAVSLFLFGLKYLSLFFNRGKASFKRSNINHFVLLSLGGQCTTCDLFLYLSWFGLMWFFFSFFLCLSLEGLYISWRRMTALINHDFSLSGLHRDRQNARGSSGLAGGGSPTVQAPPGGNHGIRRRTKLVPIKMILYNLGMIRTRADEARVI